MLVVTNFPGFPEKWLAANGKAGTTAYARDAAGFLRFRHVKDAVYLVNCDTRLVLALATGRLSSATSPPIIAVDLVLRQPTTFRDHILAYAKKVIFGRVDYFIHYFSEYTGLDYIYGVGGRRATFIPFKANLWDFRSSTARPDGDYVLCIGRSLRDYDTYLTALELCGLPGAIVDPFVSSVWSHGSCFSRTLDNLPSNVAILPDDMSDRSQAQLLRGARLVVVPLLRRSLVASGISTVLNAMALGKCVIASEGPTTSAFSGRELLIVPGEDPSALGALIAQAWADEELRNQTAEAGRQYAYRCGSAQDFYGRIIEWMSTQIGNSAR